MAKLIPVFVLDTKGVTGLQDSQGNAIKTPQLHSLVVTLDSNPKIGKELYVPTNGTFYPDLIGAAIKSYFKPTPPPAKPVKPTGLATSAITATGMTATWTATPKATKYTVDVTPTVAGFPQTITATTVNLTALTAATEYTVSVKACNAGGCSAAATKKATTTAAAVVKAPVTPTPKPKVP